MCRTVINPEFRTARKSCEICGIDLVLRNSRDLARKRFCSRKCLWESVSRANIAAGRIPPCGTPESNAKKGRTLSVKMAAGLIPKPPRRPRPNRQYCHDCNKRLSAGAKAYCRGCFNRRKSNGTNFSCPQCGQDIYVTPSRANAAGITGMVFCSLRCSGRFYASGKTPLHLLIRHSVPYRDWAKSILARDGNCCVECGSKQFVQVHHTRSFREIFAEFLAAYPNLNPTQDRYVLLELSAEFAPFWQPEIAAAVCVDCHEQIHGRKFKHYARCGRNS